MPSASHSRCILSPSCSFGRLSFADFASSAATASRTAGAAVISQRNCRQLKVPRLYSHTALQSSAAYRLSALRCRVPICSQLTAERQALLPLPAALGLPREVCVLSSHSSKYLLSCVLRVLFVPHILIITLSVVKVNSKSPFFPKKFLFDNVN